MQNFGPPVALERFPDALEERLRSTPFAAACENALRRESGEIARGSGAPSPSTGPKRCAVYPRCVDFGVHKTSEGAARDGKRYVRSVFASNPSEEPMVVLHARLTPPRACLSISDVPGDLDEDADYRFMAVLPGTRPGCVSEPLAIRVEFEAAQAERGVNAAWLCVLCAPEELVRKAMRSGDWGEVEKAFEVSAVCVTATLMVSGTISHVLDVEAPSYVPRKMKDLFDLALCTLNVRGNMRGPTHVQLIGICKKVRKIYGHFASNEFERWTKMLQLEQAAQQKNIEDLDLFNIELDLVDDSRSVSGVPDHWLYRLHVPGLAENRPPILPGDFVFLRMPQYTLPVYCVVRLVNPSESFVYVSLRPPTPDTPAKRLGAHVRFTLQTHVFSLMHAALFQVLCEKRDKKDVLLRMLPGGQLDEHDWSGGRENDITPQYSILNEEQRQVVIDVCGAVNPSSPYIIWGPPGTGKTLTVIETCVELLRRRSDAKILLAAPAAFAADILCSRLAQRVKFSTSELLRVNDIRRTVESVKPDVLPYCLEIEEDMRATSPFSVYRSPTIAELQSARVIVTSCASASMLNTMSARWTPTHIFIDEAAQALMPETLITLSMARYGTAVILAGDSKQLGPVVHSVDAAKQGFNKSLLEMWMDFAHLTNGTQLRLSYRSHEDIIRLPSRLFYDGKVMSRASEENVSLPANWAEFSEGAGNGRPARMMFYGVKGQQRREGNTLSWTNPIEAAELVDLLTALLDKTSLTQADVGVMATYRRQAILIRTVLRARSLGAVRVGTCDDWQGQENRIVFISTVVTRPQTLERLDAQIGFLNNPKRFNVAISRAMALNVIVGHPLVLMQNKLWRELLRDCVRRDAYRGAGAEHLPSWARASSPIHDILPEEDLEPYGFNISEKEKSERRAIADAISEIAELSLLGAGASDALGSPDSCQFDDFGDEPVWRVAV